MGNSDTTWGWEKKLSRRQALQGAALAGLGLSSGGLLAACGGGGGDEAAPTQAKAKRGGRLRTAFIGAGKAETLNPGVSTDNVIGIVRTYNLFDTLFRDKLTSSGEPEPGLAIAWTPNSDSTSWEFKLRPDVLWHDGKPFAADDVIYSLRSMAEPGSNANTSVANVRLDELKKTDDLTVVAPLKRPDTLFPFLLVNSTNAIVQDGTKDFRNPVGTGGFVYEEFTVGERSLFSRNPNYWDGGKPYVDELEIISIDDDAARLNALLGGDIDVMGAIPFSQAAAYKESSEIKLVDTPGLTPYLFYMRTDVKPFNDVRVRQAMKLIVDRQAMIDVAISGFGEVANDLVGKGLPYYADELPQREQDIDQAKSLLKQAGYDSLTVTLNASPINTGLVEAATLFVEQAKAAGVQVNIDRVPANAFFDTSLQYLKLPFASSYWLVGSLAEFYLLALAKDAPYNETHWRSPEFDKLLSDALSATDEATAKEKWFEVQKMQYEEGGYLIWANVNNTDAAAPNVNGITPSRSNPVGMPTGFIDAWLA